MFENTSASGKVLPILDTINVSQSRYCNTVCNMQNSCLARVRWSPLNRNREITRSTLVKRRRLRPFWLSVYCPRRLAVRVMRWVCRSWCPRVLVLKQLRRRLSMLLLRMSISCRRSILLIPMRVRVGVTSIVDLRSLSMMVLFTRLLIMSVILCVITCMVLPMMVSVPCLLLRLLLRVRSIHWLVPSVILRIVMIGRWSRCLRLRASLIRVRCRMIVPKWRL